MKPLRAALNCLALTAAGGVLGVFCGVLCGGFGFGVEKIAAAAREHFAFNVWFLPLAGLLTAALYRLTGRKGQGMGAVFAAARGEGNVSLCAVGVQYAGAWSAHLFCASVGREGAGVQIGAALGNNFGRLLPLRGAGRALTVAGMAAGFTALFMTPLAAFFFALEVTVVGKLDIRALLPSLAAAAAAYCTAGALGLSAAAEASFSLPQASFLLFGKVFALGALFGLAGLFFSRALRAFSLFFRAAVRSPLLRAAAAGVLLACLSFLTGGRYAGLGSSFFSDAFAGKEIFAYDWAVKILFTAATLGAGFVGGEVTAMFASGAALGAVLAPLFGVPPELAVCLGYAFVFGAATNTFFAPVLLCAESFGFGMLPYALVCTLSAYVFHFGRSVYAQKFAFRFPLMPKSGQKKPPLREGVAAYCGRELS